MGVFLVLVLVGSDLFLHFKKGVENGIRAVDLKLTVFDSDAWEFGVWYNKWMRSWDLYDRDTTELLFELGNRAYLQHLRREVKKLVDEGYYEFVALHKVNRKYFRKISTFFVSEEEQQRFLDEFSKKLWRSVGWNKMTWRGVARYFLSKRGME